MYNFLSSIVTKALLTTGVVLISSVNQSVASGFAVPEISVSGLAQSNAMVANAKDLGALPYNPAAMAFHDGSSMTAGVVLVKPDLSVDTGNGSVDSEADDIIAIPLFSAHHTIGGDMSVGISVNAPFGLETDWPLGTFDAQFPGVGENGEYPLGGPLPTKSALEIIAISPSIATKINDNLSLSAGVDYYYMRNVDFNTTFNNPLTPNYDMSGDGRGIGFNLSGLYRLDAWSFGISFHSTANINVEGTIKTPDYLVAALNLPTTNVTADFEVPSRLQLGLRHQLTDRLAWEFDITRTGWESFDVLEVKEGVYGQTVLRSENHWDDANAYRLGVTYDVNPDTQLRAGYSFDETPQRDDYFSARIPDADRHLFSVGFGHKIAEDWTLEAGYMYVKFNDRSISQPTWEPDTTEFNGTSAVDGDYESSVHLLAIGVNKTFL